MKSIMEQASSIMKAIEKAWISAENPKEFSIKIFEKEERNFFGMSVKPAKIAIFFEDNAQQPGTHQEKVQKPRVEKKETVSEKKEIAPKQPTKPITKTASQVASHPKKKTESSVHSSPTEKQHARPSTVWNEQLITTTKQWIEKTLSIMGMNELSFELEPTGKILKLTFAKPLIENPVVEKQLFRSIAHLVISSLRNQYKQEIKDLKIVLIRPQS